MITIRLVAEEQTEDGMYVSSIDLNDVSAELMGEFLTFQIEGLKRAIELRKQESKPNVPR